MARLISQRGPGSEGIMLAEFAPGFDILPAKFPISPGPVQIYGENRGGKTNQKGQQ